MVANSKEGVPLYQYGRPLNIIFHPDQLTDRGVTARRWVIRGFIGFPLLSIVGFLVAKLAGFA